MSQHLGIEGHFRESPRKSGSEQESEKWDSQDCGKDKRGIYPINKKATEDILIIQGKKSCKTSDDRNIWGPDKVSLDHAW